MALPSHTIELVEEAYRAWNASGPGAFLEFTTDGVELHDAPELPDAQVWAGREAVLARVEDVAAAIGGRWADVDDVRAIGDQVLVSLTWRLERGSPTSRAQRSLKRYLVWPCGSLAKASTLDGSIRKTAA